MRSSRGRVDTAQKPNKSGQILDQRWKIIFVILRNEFLAGFFFVLQKILVLMVLTLR